MHWSVTADPSLPHRMMCALTGCNNTHNAHSCSQMAAVPPVPLVAPAPPAPVPNLQAVFAVCGITAEVTCTRVIMNEVFTSPEDLSVLESNAEVTEMVKHLASCTAADGHAVLRTVQIKKIQALVWWVCDEIKHGQALTTADWDAPAVNMAMECKCVNKECESADVGVKDQSNLIQMILTSMRVLFSTCWHKLVASKVSLFIVWSAVLTFLLLLPMMQRNACINCHSQVQVLMKTIAHFFAGSRLSLSTLPGGHGLNPATQWRMDVEPLWHG